MATVNAFQIDGLKIWFWSNDHEPPHFHAKRKGEWEVKVCFMLDQAEMIEVMAWSKRRPTKTMLKSLTASAAKHRVELLKQWQELRDKEGRQEGRQE